MMRFTRRSKKGKDKDMVHVDRKNGNNDNGNGMTTKLSRSWRPGSSNTTGPTSKTSRSDSMKSLKSQNAIQDVELEATATGDSTDQFGMSTHPTPEAPKPPTTSAALARSSVDRLQEVQSGDPFYDPDEVDENDSIKMKCQSIPQPSNHKAPSTPTSQHEKAHDETKPKRLPFVPPVEINIDLNSSPLSPIRDPAMPQPETTLLEPPSHVVGQMSVSNDDITVMKRQLLDSQRLVRLILGKPLSYSSTVCEIDASLLDTNTILQAIRAFALMKQELGQLRSQKEAADGDPPAILQTLSSPTTTSGSPSLSTPSSRSVSYAASKSIPRDTTGTARWESSSPISPPTNSVFALWDANKRIEKLEEELQRARTTSINEGNEYTSLEQKYQRLLELYEAAVTENRRNLDGILEEVASVPRRVLAKDSIRDKLRTYVESISRYASLSDKIETDHEPIDGRTTMLLDGTESEQISQNASTEEEDEEAGSEQEIIGDHRDLEIIRLRNLLRQSQTETDDLKCRLNRLTETSAPVNQDEDIKENKNPIVAFDNTRPNIIKPLPHSQQDQSSEEEKKADE
jgi:hypothetical protein